MKKYYILPAVYLFIAIIMIGILFSLITAVVFGFSYGCILRSADTYILRLLL